MKTSVLVVDDDRVIAEHLCSILRKGGYEVARADGCDQAMAHLMESIPDLMLLDAELPGISGFRFLGLLKENPRTATIPVIMLTVLGDEAHKIQGLQGGADDYIVKPCSGRELLARVEALLRRSRNAGRMKAVLQAGPISMDLDGQSAHVGGKRLDLTRTEFDLLALLIAKPGHVFSYANLCEALSRGAREVTPDSLYTHVGNLRSKLGPRGLCIETAHGLGYRFTPPPIS